MSKVTIYATLLCPYCYAAKRVLKQNGINFEVIRVDKQAAHKQEMIAKSKRFTVPQIFIDDDYIGGYNELVQYTKLGKLNQLINV